MKLLDRLTDVAVALVALPRELQHLVESARSIERALLHPEDRTKHLVTIQLSRFDESHDSAGNPVGVWKYAAHSRRLALDVSESRGVGARTEFRFEALEPETLYDFQLHAPVGFLVSDIRVGAQSRFPGSASGGIQYGRVNTGLAGQLVVFIVECF
jgi:hypothetical protein